MTDLSKPDVQQPRDTGVTLQRPAIVGLLYLLNLVTGFSAIVGLILAYIWRGEGQTQEWEQSHFTYLIRSFWIGLLVCVLLMALFFGGFFSIIAAAESSGEHLGQGEPAPAVILLAIFGTFGLGLIGTAWFCVRTIISMVKASNREPMPRPKTWLF